MIARRLLEKPVLLSIEPELEKAQKTLGSRCQKHRNRQCGWCLHIPSVLLPEVPEPEKTTVLKVIL